MLEFLQIENFVTDNFLSLNVAGVFENCCWGWRARLSKFRHQIVGKNKRFSFLVPPMCLCSGINYMLPHLEFCSIWNHLIPLFYLFLLVNSLTFQTYNYEVCIFIISGLLDDDSSTPACVFSRLCFTYLWHADDLFQSIILGGGSIKQKVYRAFSQIITLSLPHLNY